jgi:hypothetical protein
MPKNTRKRKDYENDKIKLRNAEIEQKAKIYEEKLINDPDKKNLS